MGWSWPLEEIGGASTVRTPCGEAEEGMRSGEDMVDKKKEAFQKENLSS